MEARGRVLKESETDDHVKQMSQSLGPREQRTQAFWIAMCNPCTVAAHPYDDRMDVSRMSTEEAKVALRHIETFVNGATLPTPRLHNVLPIALVLSDTIELLEVLKFSYRFLDMATTQSRNKSHAFYRNVSSDDVDRIKGLIKNRAELIFEFVRNWRDNILRNEQTILWDRHFEGSIGAVLKELINHKELRKVIPNFRNSAVDSLDGILKIKVP